MFTSIKGLSACEIHKLQSTDYIYNTSKKKFIWTECTWRSRNSRKLIREAKGHNRNLWQGELKITERNFWSESAKEILTKVVAWFYTMWAVTQNRQKHSISKSFYRWEKATWHSLFRGWWNTFWSKSNSVKTQIPELSTINQQVICMQET